MFKNKLDNNKYDYDIEKEDIIKELEYLNLIQNNQPDTIINNNNENIKRDLSKKNNSKEEQDFLNTKKFLFWKNNSCAFDSFLSIFINSIKPNIDNFKFNTEDNKTIKENKDYNLYIKFVIYIINSINNNNRNYFTIYIMNLINQINVIYFN